MNDPLFGAKTLPWFVTQKGKQYERASPTTTQTTTAGARSRTQGHCIRLWPRPSAVGNPAAEACAHVM